jgi:general secretion pathway protein D
LKRYLITTALAAALMSGCAADKAFREGSSLIQAGQVEQGLARIEEAMRLEPRRQDYRTYLMRQREAAVQRLLVQSDMSRQQGDLASAEALIDRALAIDSTNARAKLAREALDRDRRHLALTRDAELAFDAGKIAEAEAMLRTVLTENRQYRGALELQRRLEERSVATREPALSPELQRPITLEFRDADLRTVFELIARTTGVNIFFDRDVRADLRTTVFVRNTALEDVIRFLLVTNQLERRILNENTLLIYPNTPAKVKEYQDLVTRTFYLTHADAKQVASMIRTMVRTRDVFIDEKLRLVIIRDTPDAVRMAEKLVAAHDIGDSEVMLEVEVLEISSALLTDLGLRYPDQVSISIVGAAGIPGTITLQEWQNRSSALYRISVTHPLLVLNLREQGAKTNTLANPRIRVKDGQKARVHIGDRVPVITTTMTATSFVSESVSYLDVGLKLEVEPTISLNNEVSIKMGLEVSNIVQEIRSPSGTLTYQLGTRNAATVLHLRDGETQILAGLISDDERRSAQRVPGLGRLPVVGRLFSNERSTANQTEIVLLITPRILRTLARPGAQLTEFLSGTESATGAPPLLLRSIAPTPGGAPPAQSTPFAPAPAPAPAKPLQAPARDTGTPAAAAARLIAHAPRQAKTGEVFTVAVDLLTETAMRGGSFDIAYDSGRLKVVKVEEGDLLKKAPDKSSFSHNLQEKDGRLSVSYAAPEALTGTANVARITFQVTGAHEGTTLITLSNVAGVDGAGRSVVMDAPAPPTLSLSR